MSDPVLLCYKEKIEVKDTMALREPERSITIMQVAALTIPVISYFMISYAPYGAIRQSTDWAVVFSFFGVVLGTLSFKRGVRYVALLAITINVIGLLWYIFREALFPHAF
jgi:EamA domain-containing membrane protein RarD